jgi:hypothetical protein
VLSIGGFNPSYNPAPLTFPSTLTPVAMVHGAPSDEVYLRFEGYFAITTNTLQFGASVEAQIHSGGWSIHGTIAFDALLQRVPFHFEFDINASVSVSYDGHNLASLTLSGSLSGPGPVVLKVKVSIELLFFEVSFSDTFELGPTTPPPAPTAPDLLSVLSTELTDPTCLRAAGGPDPLVTVTAADATLTVPVVAPTGALVWDQQRAPLGLVCDRVGGTPLPAPVQVTATTTGASTQASDWFAPGQFINLSDDQALTQPGYELLSSGLRLGDGPDHDGPSAQVTPAVQQIRIPEPPTVATTVPFPGWLRTGVLASPAPAVTVTPEPWTLSAPTGVVGLEGSELVVDGSTVTIQPAAQQGVQAVGAPGTAYRFAHVQDTGGIRTTRLVSARPLTAGTDYLAVVVPAFDASGAPAWTGAAAVTVALYDAWRFRTAQPAGGFEQLAQLLQPGDALAQTGEAVLHYPRVTAAAPLSVFGALVGHTSGRTVTEDPLPAAVSSDLPPVCAHRPGTPRDGPSSACPHTAARGA